MTHFIAYTDGACSGNPGPGGWAWSLWENECTPDTVITGASGGLEQTTNNVMELRAAQDLFQHIFDQLMSEQIGAHDSLTVFMDSEYVLKGLTEWMPGWKARNFKKVKNDDIWRPLAQLFDNICEQMDLKLEWVKGHSGDYGNELVDDMAVAMRDKMKLGGDDIGEDDVDMSAGLNLSEMAQQMDNPPAPAQEPAPAAIAPAGPQEYMIVQSKSANELGHEIEGFLSNGWDLQGGPFISQNEDGKQIFNQAVTR